MQCLAPPNIIITNPSSAVASMSSRRLCWGVCDVMGVNRALILASVFTAVTVTLFPVGPCDHSSLALGCCCGAQQPWSTIGRAAAWASRCGSNRALGTSCACSIATVSCRPSCISPSAGSCCRPRYPAAGVPFPLAGTVCTLHRIFSVVVVFME